MIKKIVGLFLFISIGISLFASHLVGGSLGYQYLGKVGVNYRYKIILTVYNNCDSSSQIPLPISTQGVGIYLQDIPNNPMGGGNKTLFQSLTLNLVDSNEVTPPTSSGCAIGTAVCIYKGVYEATVDLPLNFNGYHLYFENFARNAAITNLLNPGATAMAFHAYIAPSLVNNSSPVFLDDPVPFLCINDTVSILNTAIDPDGDQLIFSFVTPMAGNGTGANPLPWTITPVLYNAGYSTAQPFGAGGYSFINGGNGLTQYMAPALGNYVVAVEIREYRAGKLIGVSRRDLQLLVINCPPNPPPNLSASGGSGITQYTIEECASLNFPITFTDANGDSLTLSSGGQIFSSAYVNPPATIDSLVLGDSTVTASFNWTSSCGTSQALPYLFNVSATDNGCPPKTTNVIYEITVTPHTPPTTISGLLLVCANTTATYSTNFIASSTYNWTISGGIINSGQGTNSISVTWGGAGTGIVNVNSLSLCGCPSVIIDTNITILAAPTPNAGNNVTICLGDTIQIGGSPTGPPGATYSWTPAIKINNTTIANPLVWPTTTTNYIVNASNGVCSAKDTVLVSVGSATINAGNDTSICLGNSTQLNASGGVIYSWLPITGLSNPNIANPIATPIVTTTYHVLITDALGCSGIDSVKITIATPPVISLNNDTTICKGSCVSLIASGGTIYQWSPITGLSNSNVANPIACAVVTTTYIVTVSNAASCISIDSVKITVNPLPTIKSNNDTAVCIGNCVQLNTIGGSSYSWSPSTGLSNSAIGNPLACPLVTTNYVVTGTNINGCIAKDTVKIIINPLPVVSAGVDKAICVGSSVTIGGSPSGPAGSSFSWTPTATLNNNTIANPIASPITTTNYVLTVVNLNGCSKKDSAIVSVNLLPIVNAGNDTSICIGSSLTIGGSPTTPFSNSTYSWTPAATLNNSTISNPIASPISSPTSYIVTVTDSNTCIKKDTVVISLNPLPTIKLNNDTAVCIGNCVQLNTIGGISYSWSPSTGLSNSAIGNPLACPIITTNYVVSGTNINGCIAKDTVKIIINPLPVVSAGVDKAICVGSSVTIGGSPSGPAGSSFSWTPTATLNNNTIANPIASPITTTNYVLTVVNLNGCSKKDSAIVSVNLLPIVNAGNDTSICIGSSVTIGGNPTTSAASSTFSWTPAATLNNSTISNPIASPISSPTSYIVTVTDSNTCVKKDTLVISLNPLPTIKSNNDTTVCIGNCVQMNTIGGNSYSWSPSTGLSNSAILNPLACPIITTNYVVTGTNINGCIAKDTVKITINPLPVVSAGTDVWICIGYDAQLNATGGIDYLWTPSLGLNDTTISNPIASPLDSTLYIVNGIDIKGCSNTDSILVIVNNIVPINLGNNHTICSGDSIQLGGTPTSPNGTTYGWIPIASLDNPTSSNPIAFPTITTTYYLTASNDTCSSIDSVTIFVNQLPTINAGTDVTICFGDTTQLIANGGNTYIWTPIAGLSNSAIANPLAFPTSTTPYIVSGTDTNFCVNKDTVVVTVNPLPNVSAGTDTSFCFGGSVQLNATGATGYLWTPSLGLSDTTIANPIANPFITTNYIVFGTDVNVCSNTDTVVVTVHSLPIITAFSDTAICIGASAQLNASGGINYLWTPSLGLSNTTIANPIATPLITSTYFVDANDGNGCSNSDSVIITVNNLPTINAGSDIAICFGDTTQLIANGGNTFAWTPIAGLSNSTIANPLVFPTSTTPYIVSGTDTNFCVNKDTVIVTVNPLPNVSTGTDTSFCFGGSVQLTAIGATGYLWTPSLGLSDTTIANPIANPLSTTSYIVVGTDLNICSNADTVVVTVHPLPIITAFSDTSICIGASAQLNASGGINYLWTPSLGLSNTTIANPITTPLITSTYFVDANDGNGCSNSDSVIITVNNLPTINAGNDVTICFGDTTQLTAVGGNTYIWTPIAGLSNSAIANPLAFPTSTTPYIVSGTDTNFCVNKDTVIVTVNPLPNVSAGTDTSFCFGGSVQLNATGATGYLWIPSLGLSDTTIANPIANPLSTTNYIVVGTDLNICSNADTVVVTVHSLPIITAFSDTAICIGASAQLNASGGINYLWTPSLGLSNTTIANPIATPLITSTYFVDANDGNGCSNSDSVIITVNNLPTINAGNDVAICFGDTTQLLATGGNTYIWTPITGLSNSAIANPLAFPTSTTPYIVSGTDTNFCVSKDTLVVTVNPLPIINIGISDTVYLCLGDSTQLIATGGINYQWTPNTFISSNSIFNPYVYPPNTSIYSVIGTDVNSCKNRDSILVSVFTILDLIDTTICIGDSIQLLVSGPLNASYSWSPTTNLSDPNIANPFTNTQTTITYSVVVQNTNGCTDTTSLTVVAVDKPTAEFTIETSLSCEGILVNFNNQSLLANTYFWNFGDGQQSTLINPSHVFNYGTSITTILTAFNNNGCFNTYSLPIINGNFEDLFNLIPANVFTPNRDGFNDLFRLDLPKNISKCTNVQIFNRWGMMVFESVNQNIGWDGRTSTGVEVPAGTYFYVVEVNGIIKKGALTLLR